MFFSVSVIGLFEKESVSTRVSQNRKLFQVEELKRDVVNEL